jgi:hypothetical protein
MDGTGSGSCTVVGFCISGVEPLCSAARELVNWEDGSYGNSLWRWEVDGTGSGSCTMVGFFISGFEPLCSAARVS